LCYNSIAKWSYFYGTGESFVSGSNSTYSDQPFVIGDGIYKSINDGASFSKLSSTSSPTTFRFVNSLANNGTKIFAACTQGLKMSDNEGLTWSNPTGITNSMFEDVAASTNNVIASTSNGLFVSNDGGVTFENKIKGTPNVGLPPSGGLDRIEVTIAPSNENIMYAVMSKSGGLEGVYKSTNAGVNWTVIGAGGTAVFNPLGGQGTWNIALGVSALNPDMVYVGGQLFMYRFNPANSGWEVIGMANGNAGAGSYIHADMHGVLFNHTNKETMYVITDGGFFRSSNASTAEANDIIFNEKNKNYSTYQCYGMSANRLGWVTAGAQDNGTMQMRYSNANSNQQGNTIDHSDGMMNAMSDYNTSIIFTTSQSGRVSKSSDGGVNTSSPKSCLDTHIDSDQDGSTEDNFWITPMTLKEKGSKSVMFLGTNSGVWICQNIVDGITYQWFKLVPSTGDVRYTHLTEDGNTLFVGTKNGNLIRYDNLHVWDTTYNYVNPTAVNGVDNNWNRMHITSTIVKNFGGQVVAGITTDAGDNNIVVTLANYGNSAYVYQSPMVGMSSTSFVDITNNLPKMPVYGAVFVKGITNQLLVGTELGVWGTDNGGVSWTEVNFMNADQSTWHPRTLVTEIIQKDQLHIANSPWYDKGIIYTGTHGRGTFMSTSFANTWAVGTTNITGKATQFTVFPSPAKDIANIKYTSLQATQASISVYDMRGSIVLSSIIKVHQGENSSSVDIKGLPTGAYVLSLNVNGEVSASSFVKN
jgi:hypothetical protein